MGGGPAIAANPSPVARKRIVIVGGGGPAGLAALRVLLDRPQLKGPNASWEVYAFEAKPDVGGVWLTDPNKGNGYTPTEELSLPSGEEPGLPGAPPSPLYDALYTNVPHPLMSYHEFSYPPETPLFVQAPVVQKYMDAYAEHYNLRRHIEFDTSVRDLRWDSRAAKWIVRVEPTNRGDLDYQRKVEHTFDAAIISTGRYFLPYYTDLPGVAEWRASERKLIHSVYYREPSFLKGLSVLIVGGGPSGKDISIGAAEVTENVILSVSGGVYSNEEKVKIRARLVELRPEDGAAVYADGHIDRGIDIVVLATGYKFSYPFLDGIHRESPATEALPDHLVYSNFTVYPVARQTFPLRTYPFGSLAIMGMPRGLVSFPNLDCQAQAVATVLLNPSALDVQHEEDLVEERYWFLHREFKGEAQKIAKNWHEIAFEKDGWRGYRASLLEIADNKQEWGPQPWELEFTESQAIPSMRPEWFRLVQEGIAQEWLKDVGRSGRQDWIDLMRRVVNHAKQRGSPVRFYEDVSAL